MGVSIKQSNGQRSKSRPQHTKNRIISHAKLRVIAESLGIGYVELYFGIDFPVHFLCYHSHIM